MIRGIIAFPAFALLSVLLTRIRAELPSTAADQDPISFFASLAALPTDQQDAFLQMAGQSMMQNDDSITCNIFGGEDSCQTMSSGSKFATECKAYRPNLKVDCAYYAASEEQLDSHPADALNTFLNSADAYTSVTKHCPQCLDNLKALWCVQALPECGSFQTHVHKAIFPAILEAKKAEDAGQPQSIAIAEAVPGLISAMSKTMACKEMCDAVVTTCSCKADGDDVLTFGEAIENAEKVEDGFKQLGLQTLGDDFRDTLFRDIWDKPLCEIFTSKDDAEFAGYCDEDVIGDNAKCTSAKFCEGLDDAQRAGTETIIATQLARSVFAFVEGPAGVMSQRSSSTDVAKTGVVDQGFEMIKKPGTGPKATATATASATVKTEIKDADVTAIEVIDPPPAETKGGSTFGTVFGILLSLTVVGGVAFFGWKKYQEHQANRYGDYGPMGMEAYGDDGIPLQ